MKTMDDFGNYLGLNSNEDKNDSCFPTLTLKERLTGFGICVGIGFIIQFLSFGSLLGLLTGKASKFAILYSLGNIVSIVG